MVSRRMWLVLAIAIVAGAAGTACSSSTAVGSAGGGSSTAGSGGDAGSHDAAKVPDMFPCAESVCHAGQICKSSVIEAMPNSLTYGCTDIPAACAGADCKCLTDTICAGMLANGGLSKCGCDDTGCYIDCVMP